MPRAPSTFRQADAAKAVKAVIAAGLRVVGVKVSNDGNIEVVTDERPPMGGENEWDRV